MGLHRDAPQAPALCVPVLRWCWAALCLCPDGVRSALPPLQGWQQSASYSHCMPRGGPVTVSSGNASGMSQLGFVTYAPGWPYSTPTCPPTPQKVQPLPPPPTHSPQNHIHACAKHIKCVEPEATTSQHTPPLMLSTPPTVTLTLCQDVIRCTSISVRRGMSRVPVAESTSSLGIRLSDWVKAFPSTCPFHVSFVCCTNSA